MEQHSWNLASCNLCPRDCKVNRLAGETGICGASGTLTVARAALHHWEEPCISGTRGSGTVFFSGCGLRCTFCQNAPISLGLYGKEIDVQRLCEIFFELRDQGAHNINLVTPTPYLPLIAEAIVFSKSQGFSLPFVANCGGYENVEVWKQMDGLIDIYLPDLKFCDSRVARKYARAPEYFERATEVIKEMFRQVGPPVLDADGIMTRGVIVRHLMIPGELFDTRRILSYILATYGNSVFISLMNQYTPPNPPRENAPARPLSYRHYEAMIDFLVENGQTNAFTQDMGTDEESFIPPFDRTGV